MKKIISMESFVERYESRSTQLSYKSALKKFLEYMEVDSFKTYFNGKRDYEEDIEKFHSKLNGHPPKTVRLYLNTVKSFFRRNKIKLEDDFWEDLNRRIRGSRARTVDRIPTIEELRAILTHTDAKGKALFLMLASSGMRIGEALSIKVSDIKQEEEPVEIRIRGEFTKTGDPRITFISQEAKQALDEWLKVRKQYLITACGRSRRYEKNPHDDRLFPFDSSTAWRIWSKAVSRAGLEEFDPSTDRRTIHIHVLRKFFKTRTSLIIQGDIVEALMGHSSGLDAIYLKAGDIKKELRETYKKAEKELLIFTDIKTIKEYTSHLEEMQSELFAEHAGLISKNKNLEKEVMELRTELNQVHSLLKKSIDISQHPENYWNEGEHRQFERESDEQDRQLKEKVMQEEAERLAKKTPEEIEKEKRQFLRAIELAKQKRDDNVLNKPIKLPKAHHRHKNKTE